MYDEENIMHSGGSSMLKLKTFLIYFAPRFCAFLWSVLKFLVSGSLRRARESIVACLSF